VKIIGEIYAFPDQMSKCCNQTCGFAPDALRSSTAFDGFILLPSRSVIGMENHMDEVLQKNYPVYFCANKRKVDPTVVLKSLKYIQIYFRKKK
jgi:hypothetical protein